MELSFSLAFPSTSHLASIAVAVTHIMDLGSTWEVRKVFPFAGKTFNKTWVTVEVQCSSGFDSPFWTPKNQLLSPKDDRHRIKGVVKAWLPTAKHSPSFRAALLWCALPSQSACFLSWYLSAQLRSLQCETKCFQQPSQRSRDIWEAVEWVFLRWFCSHMGYKQDTWVRTGKACVHKRWSSICFRSIRFWFI